MKDKTNEPEKVIRDAKAQETFDKKMEAGRAAIPYILEAMKKYGLPRCKAN